MRIQQIQNNNTNFQGLYGSKTVINRLNQPMKTEVDKLAQDYDVIVKKRIFKKAPAVFTPMSGLIGGMSASLLTSDLKIIIPTGIASMLVAAAAAFKAFSTKTIQLGDKVEKDDKTNKLKLSGVKTEEVLLNKKLNCDELEKKYLSDVFKQGSVDILRKYIKSGKINLLKESFRTLDSRLSANEYKDLMNVFAKTQLVKDEDGNLPIHKAENANDIYNLNAYLKDYPEDLAEIYLTKNNKGELPIHNKEVINNTYALRDIASSLEKYPRVLVTIFEAKNQQGDNAIDFLRGLPITNNSEMISNIIRKVEDAKDYCVKVRGAFIPAVAKSEQEENKTLEEKINSDFDFSGIMGLLNNKSLQKSKGEQLNYSNGSSKIIDFIIDKASQEEKKVIIRELQKLTNIDYNKVDKNRISIVEKILNAEDFDLLELLRDKHLEYFPELDYAYRRIENDEFRKQVKILNFDFVGLELGARVGRMSYFEETNERFTSPLFKKEYNGRRILDIINHSENQHFAEHFREKFGQYLSDYIV